MPHNTLNRCSIHAWERRLAIQDGAECVVRVCPVCGQMELIWSRRGTRPGLRRITARKSGRTALRFADDLTK
jgi:hypothetical protein